MNSVGEVANRLTHKPVRGFVRAGDALAEAMRAIPALRPIAEEVEARRARD